MLDPKLVYFHPDQIQSAMMSNNKSADLRYYVY